VTEAGVYFTNSYAPEFYLLPWGGEGHMLPSTVTTIPLTGEWNQIADAFNANGIEALPDGTLYMVHSTSGILYHVLPDGEAHACNLTNMSGEPAQALLSGDGILLDGTTLYVVQNSFNQVRPDRYRRRLRDVFFTSALPHNCCPTVEPKHCTLKTQPSNMPSNTQPFNPGARVQHDAGHDDVPHLQAHLRSSIL
jgi:hypothetical protein